MGERGKVRQRRNRGRISFLRSCWKYRPVLPSVLKEQAKEKQDKNLQQLLGPISQPHPAMSGLQRDTCGTHVEDEP